jgi:hypothetical protein
MTEAPVINLNGSHPQRLIEDILSALYALDESIKWVAKTAPHPRDWQTAQDGDALFRIARREHDVRLHKLHEVHNELQSIGLAIQEQADARSAR